LDHYNPDIFNWFCTFVNALIFVPVRIIIAHNYTPHSFSVISWSLARELARQGHKVLFFSHQPTFDAPDTSLHGLKVVGWPEKRPTGWKSFRYYYSMHRKFKPDLVILHFAPQYVAGIAAWLLKCPNIWGYYHTAEEANIIDTAQSPAMNNWRRRRKSGLYRLFNRIICVSQFARRDIQRFFKVPANKLDLVYNALPDRWNKQFTKPSGGPVLFHLLARLDPCKRVLELTEAFMAFRNETGINARLAIAGNGPLLPALMEMISNRDDIDFLGTLPYNKVDDFISQAHYLLCPSLVETFGMVNAEAIMNATPVLANAVGGIPEVVLDGETGFLANGLEKDDWVQLFMKASKLVQNEPEQYANMQAKCRAMYLERFTIEQYVSIMTKKIGALEINTAK
jgi:glycosyltransferase involved in cell wall biosynthesis